MKVLTYGNVFTPTRFSSYKSCEGMSYSEIADHKASGWLERELTPTEEARVGDEGCLGDLLDCFVKEIVCTKRNGLE